MARPIYVIGSPCRLHFLRARLIAGCIPAYHAVPFLFDSLSDSVRRKTMSKQGLFGLLMVLASFLWIVQTAPLLFLVGKEIAEFIHRFIVK